MIENPTPNSFKPKDKKIMKSLKYYCRNKIYSLVNPPQAD